MMDGGDDAFARGHGGLGVKPQPFHPGIAIGTSYIRAHGMAKAGRPLLYISMCKMSRTGFLT